MKCPNCNHDNREGAKICDYCGAPLFDPLQGAATKALGDTDIEEIIPRWGSSRYTDRIHLNVTLNGDEHVLTFDTSEMEELVLGRLDPDTNTAPNVDLTYFEARDKGVSRRHATITRRDGNLHLTDLGSPNGTFLNGQRLITNQPRVLRDGDDIRLGYLVVRISFERN